MAEQPAPTPPASPAPGGRADPRRYDRVRHPLAELTLARLREVFREPGTLFWVFGFPVLLSVGLGIAFRSKPPEPPRIAVIDDAPLAAALDALDTLHAIGVDAAEADRALRRGKVDLLLLPGDPPRYRFDPDQPTALAARLAVDAALQTRAGRRDAFIAMAEPVRRPGARYIDFLLPGLIGLNLMGSSMWGVGWSLVEARSRKLLKRLAATPVRRHHLLGSWMLSRALLLAAEVAALLVFGGLAFGVRVHGSWLLLAVICVAGAAAFIAIALCIAARPRTSEVASGWMNAVMMPMWVLSGSFFSYERFPEAALPLLRLLPLTALNDALRAVMNDGAGPAAVAAPIVVLVVWAAAGFAFAARTFRWQ